MQGDTYLVFSSACTSTQYGLHSSVLGAPAPNWYAFVDEEGKKEILKANCSVRPPGLPNDSGIYATRRVWSPPLIEQSQSLHMRSHRTHLRGARVLPKSRIFSSRLREEARVVAQRGNSLGQDYWYLFL